MEAFQDGLFSFPNRKARGAIVEGLAEVLLNHPKCYKRAIMVAGDLQVGGFCRIAVGPGREIPQWIASPFSNLPNRLLYWAARYALPRKRAGFARGKQLWARDFWAKPARNALSLSLRPTPNQGEAPLVQGDLLYESAFTLKRFSRTLG